MRTRSLFTIEALILALACEAHAHDFWVEPDTYAPRAGEPLDLRLRVGDALEGEEFPRSLRHVQRFEVLGPAGRETVPGEHLELPAGRVTLAQGGLHWVVYQSRASLAEVEASIFADYLEEEGNARWLEDWKALDPAGVRPVKESFLRCVKCLLHARAASTSVAALPAAASSEAPARFDSIVGLRLEIVLGADPATLPPGAPLPLTLLLDGTPLADAQVTARAAADRAHPLKVRTDSSGRASLLLAAPGMWLLKSVHLERAPAGAGAVYQSTWAALTLERPALPLSAR